MVLDIRHHFDYTDGVEEAQMFESFSLVQFRAD